MGQLITIEPSRRILIVPLRIPIGTGLSDVLETYGHALKAVFIPTPFTDPPDLEFQVATLAAGPFVDLYASGGSVVSVAYPGPGRVVAFAAPNIEQLAPWLFVKIRTGTAGAPTLQTAERVLKCVLGLGLQ